MKNESKKIKAEEVIAFAKDKFKVSKEEIRQIIRYAAHLMSKETKGE